MYAFFFTIWVALAIPFINCEDATTAQEDTTEGEPCSAQLERLAENHCSKVKKYLVGAPSVSWFQASLNCKKYGYKLASITSEEENDRMLKQLKLQGLNAPQVWIGLNDLAQEDKYMWDSNAKLNSTEYLNWYVGEPNNAFDDENCVNLYPDGSFNDFNCNSNMPYVCEYY